MNFNWVTINVSSMDKSLDFYQNTLGLKLNRKFSPTPEMEIAFLDCGGTEVELIYDSNNPTPTHGLNISIGFGVESLDKEFSRLESLGVSIEGPFQPNPMSRFIYIKDPDGVKIQLSESN